MSWDRRRSCWQDPWWMSPFRTSRGVTDLNPQFRTLKLWTLCSVLRCTFVASLYFQKKKPLRPLSSWAIGFELFAHSFAKCPSKFFFTGAKCQMKTRCNVISSCRISPQTDRYRIFNSFFFPITKVVVVIYFFRSTSLRGVSSWRNLTVFMINLLEKAYLGITRNLTNIRIACWGVSLKEQVYCL